MQQHPNKQFRHVLALCMLFITSIWIVAPAMHTHHDEADASGIEAHHTNNCTICLHWTTWYDNALASTVLCFFAVWSVCFTLKPVTALKTCVKGVPSLRAPPM